LRLRRSGRAGLGGFSSLPRPGAGSRICARLLPRSSLGIAPSLGLAVGTRCSPALVCALLV
jgi:hypothetical protein